MIAYTITKILAYGSYQRFMWIRIGLKEMCVRISDELYNELKIAGIPTCQKLRYKKQVG